MKIKIQTIKLIKRMSREAFLYADVRSFPYTSKKHYNRKAKHKKVLTNSNE
jgi:hypothetical protein